MLVEALGRIVQDSLVDSTSLVIAIAAAAEVVVEAVVGETAEEALVELPEQLGYGMKGEVHS